MFSSTLDAALAYAAKGWPVLPLRPREKVPATARGLHDASTDPATIRKWFGNGAAYNVGVRTDGLLVLDADGDEGEASLAALERRHGALPETPVQLTARGRHFLFRVPDGLPVSNSASRVGPKLDVRGGGGYIAVEPSVHPTGCQYAWDVDRHPDDWPLADAPPWLLDLCRSSAKAEAPRPDAAEGETIREGARNAGLFKLACRLRRDGLGADAVLAALAAENTRRCAPPLDAAEVERIAASASRYAEGETDAPAAPLTLIDPTAWGGLAVPARRWIVPDWVPAGGATSLYGDGGVGKSIAAMQLQIACATGTRWLGLPVEPCRSIGIYCEDDPDELHRRAAAICAVAGLDLTALGDARFASRVGGDNLLMAFDGRDTGRTTAFYDAVLRAAREFAARLLVVDTAADTFGGNEIARSQVRQFVGALARIAVEIDGAVLLLAHPSVAGADAGTSGSTAWNASVRSRLHLKRPKVERDVVLDEDARILSRGKANYAGRGATVALRYDRGAFAVEPWEQGTFRYTAEDVFLRLLDAFERQGRKVSHEPRSPTYAPREFACQPPTVREGYGAAEFARAMETLFAAGRLRVETYRSANRKPRECISRTDGAANV